MPLPSPFQFVVDAGFSNNDIRKHVATIQHSPDVWAPALRAAGRMFRHTLTTAAGGGGTARFRVDLQVVDPDGTASAGVFRGTMYAEVDPNEYEQDSALRAFYRFRDAVTVDADATRGTGTDTTLANGAPGNSNSGSGFRPKIGFETNATGLFRCYIERVQLDGATALAGDMDAPWTARVMALGDYSPGPVCEAIVTANLTPWP